MASNRDSHLSGNNDPALSAGKKSPLDLLSADSLLNGSYRQAIENLLGSPLPADENPDLAGALPGKTNAPGTGGIEKPIPMPPPIVVPPIEIDLVERPPVDRFPITRNTDATISSEMRAGGLGSHVSNLGDINGDGYDDFAVVAVAEKIRIMPEGLIALPCVELPPLYAVTAYVLYGSRDGIASFDLDNLKPSQGFAIAMGDLWPKSDNWGWPYGFYDLLGAEFNKVSSAGDINHDGIGDFAVTINSGPGFIFDASHSSANPAIPQTYAHTYTIYGKPGARADINLSKIKPEQHLEPYLQPDLQPSFSVTGEIAKSLSWATRNVGDMNGDGVDDLILAADKASAEGKAAAGIVYVIYGRNGEGIKEINLDHLSANEGFKLVGDEQNARFGYSVSSAGDINGDGYDDLVVGAPGADSYGPPHELSGKIMRFDIFHNSTRVPAGESYVIYGGDFTHSVTLAGGVGNDLLVGKAGADIVVAGLGDDLVIGKGGVDFIRTGAGNDTIRIGDGSFGRIDGGGGSDRLVFDYEGAIAIDPERIIDIERFDMANGLANSMNLKAADVLALDLRVRDLGGKAALDNVLAIDGDFGDTLNLDAADGWQVWAGQSLAGYALYVSGFARIAVDTDIAVSIG